MRYEAAFMILRSIAQAPPDDQLRRLIVRLGSTKIRKDIAMVSKAWPHKMRQEETQ